jgi:Flp pilus assembly protein TadB
MEVDNKPGGRLQSVYETVTLHLGIRWLLAAASVSLVVIAATLVLCIWFIWKHRKQLADLFTNLKLLNHNLPSLTDAVMERAREVGTLSAQDQEVIDGTIPFHHG